MLVMVAGDWHGDEGTLGWSQRAIVEAADRGAQLVLHCGDFGFWPGATSRWWMAEVTHTLASLNLQLWFVDGNHEWHPELNRLPVSPTGLRWVTPQIAHIPRGHRWIWHGRQWVGLGGATSVDRVIRREGRDWWPEEALTKLDVEQVVAGGRADVMVAHDCPRGVPLDLPRPAPGWWDMASANDHRGVLRTVVNALEPSWLFHGHYHLYHDTEVDLGWPMRVIGLDCNGGEKNWVLLDTETMSTVG